MHPIGGAGKVHRKWSYIHTSCTSCRNICSTARVLRACAVSVCAVASVTHSSVICGANFSELASRTHPVRPNSMSARHHTSCIVSAMVNLVGFRSRVCAFASTCHITQSRVRTVQRTLLTLPASQLNDRHLQGNLQLKLTSVITSVPIRA
jgi:hypothetical protein